MTSRPWIAALALAGGAALLAAAPAAADRLITMKSHTDAMEMMGQKTPAQDENYLYWFGGDAIRHDTGKVSTILRFDRKKMIWINHDDKTYSVIDLPIDYKKLVPPEMAPMMEQMATMRPAAPRSPRPTSPGASAASTASSTGSTSTWG